MKSKKNVRGISQWQTTLNVFVCKSPSSMGVYNFGIYHSKNFGNVRHNKKSTDEKKMQSHFLRLCFFLQQNPHI